MTILQLFIQRLRGSTLMNMTSNVFKIATKTFIYEKETLQGFRLIIGRVLPSLNYSPVRWKLTRQQLELCILFLVCLPHVISCTLYYCLCSVTHVCIKDAFYLLLQPIIYYSLLSSVNESTWMKKINAAINNYHTFILRYSSVLDNFLLTKETSSVIVT